MSARTKHARRIDAAANNKNPVLLDAPRPWPPFTCRSIAGKTGVPHGFTHAYSNGWFAIMVRPIRLDTGHAAYHLMITNAPNTPVRSWRDLQRIKNEVFGSSCVAVEIFPNDIKVIDQANVTHLWVLPVELLPEECCLARWHDEAAAANRASP